jgi:hypothetical protein
MITLYICCAVVSFSQWTLVRRDEIQVLGLMETPECFPLQWPKKYIYSNRTNKQHYSADVYHALKISMSFLLSSYIPPLGKYVGTCDELKCLYVEILAD